MYNLNIDKKLLDEQIRKLLESNLDEDTKEGLHNLLGEIYDQSKSVRDILYWIDAGIDELNQATCQIMYDLDVDDNPFGFLLKVGKAIGLQRGVMKLERARSYARKEDGCS